MVTAWPTDDEEGFEGSLTENNVPEHVLSGSSISFGPDFGVQISDRPDQYGDAYQFDLGAVANTNVEDALAAGQCWRVQIHWPHVTIADPR